MRWPWVSRAHHEVVSDYMSALDRAEHGARMQAESWKLIAEKAIDLNNDWAARYEAIVQTIVSLKKEGYGTPVDVPLPEPQAVEDLPVSVRRAIGERAQPRTPGWRHLETVARERLKLGVEVEEVALLILNGESVEAW